MGEFVTYPVMPPRPREKEMKVLCLGLSRTSTLSLWAALKRLGYNPYHMVECAQDWQNNSMIFWDEAIQAKYYGKDRPYQPKEFDKMLWRYDAVTDIPSVLFVDELLEAYPNAKVVLTTRDFDSWAASINRTFYEILSWKRWRIVEILDSQHAKHYIPILRNSLRIWTKNDPSKRENLRAGFEDHYAHVRRVVPKDKLLEFHPSQGWEPLCKHLGQPVPNEPYPRINEGTWAVDIHYGVFWARLRIGLWDWFKYLLLQVFYRIGRFLLYGVGFGVSKWWWDSKSNKTA